LKCFIAATLIEQTCTVLAWIASTGINPGVQCVKSIGLSSAVCNTQVGKCVREYNMGSELRGDRLIMEKEKQKDMSHEQSMVNYGKTFSKDPRAKILQ
jgi:hypothetical protein